MHNENINSRVAKLRAYMQERGLSAFIIPTTDTLAAIRLTRTISTYTLAAATLHGFPQAIAPLIQVRERHQTKQAND